MSESDKIKTHKPEEKKDIINVKETPAEKENKEITAITDKLNSAKIAFENGKKENKKYSEIRNTVGEAYTTPLKNALIKLKRLTSNTTDTTYKKDGDIFKAVMAFQKEKQMQPIDGRA